MTDMIYWWSHSVAALNCGSPISLTLSFPAARSSLPDSAQILISTSPWFIFLLEVKKQLESGIRHKHPHSPNFLKTFLSQTSIICPLLPAYLHMWALALFLLEMWYSILDTALPFEASLYIYWHTTLQCPTSLSMLCDKQLLGLYLLSILDIGCLS
jgi:hypothetical protein